MVAIGFVAQIGFFGSLQHSRDQSSRYEEFRAALAEGTAPVMPVNESGQLLPAETPVAILEIPRIGVREVVGEGTTGRALASGPGHRRDSVLPGQSGTSVIMGRRAGYGGPFARLGELVRGDVLTVTTGQGKHSFTVLGVRQANSPYQPEPDGAKGRMTLVTADGPPFMPTDVLRVDAALTSDVQPTPAQIPARVLPNSEKAMSGDRSALVPLVLWTQLLVIAAFGIIWVNERVGHWHAWVIGLPVVTALGVVVADHMAATLLPNLL
ncbi:MAG: sortase [Pseudonocardiales bacterium]